MRPSAASGMSPIHQRPEHCLRDLLRQGFPAKPRIVSAVSSGQASGR